MERFQKLFDGLDRVRGVYEIDPDLSSDRVKVGGKAYTKKEPHLLEHWENHLSGKQGLGIVPIRDDQCCVFCALDIDEYDLNLEDLNKTIGKMKLPFVLCRTKSGGAHLYMFFSEPVRADIVKKRLKIMAEAVGFPAVEIFPKQKELREGDVGNWINLPYFNVEFTDRYALDAKGKAIMDLDAFCEYAESKQLSLDQLMKLKIPKGKDQPFLDGPPCLQRLASRKTGLPEGTRNSALFNMGVYARLKYGDNWSDKLEDMNRELMSQPLKAGEITQVLGSLQKGKYYYTCDQEPICNFCARDACLGRKYGVGNNDEGGGAELELMLGRLQKTESIDLYGDPIEDAPLWYMDVEGMTLTLTTKELTTQDMLIKKLAERLRKYPERVRPQRWQAILKEKIESAEIVEIPPETGTYGHIVGALQEFCQLHGGADTRMDIETGHVWEEKGNLYFKHAAFWQFLCRKGIYRSRDDGKQLHHVMRLLKAEKKQLMLDSKLNMNREVWCIKSWDEKPVEIPGKAPEEEF